MTYWNAALLGLVQGLAEFLPISSSGHLAVLQNFLAIGDMENHMLFDVLLHLGTLAAVILAFCKDVREVVIPAKFNDVYAAYNTMQQAQGFDLLPYAGEKCTQYRYRITNYPNTPDGVFATLLVFEGNIIGGDVASGAEDGFMHGFAADSARYEMPKSVIKESASPAPNTGESTQNPTESETT